MKQASRCASGIVPETTLRNITREIMMGAAKEGVQELSRSLATKALEESRGSRSV